jgi:hypothetical protein
VPQRILKFLNELYVTKKTLCQKKNCIDYVNEEVVDILDGEIETYTSIEFKELKRKRK